MSESRRKHPLLAQELLPYDLNSTHLRDLLERVISVLVETQENVQKVTKREADHFQMCSEQLYVLPEMKTDIKALLTGAGMVQKAMSKVDAWSERFSALEVKHFELANEVYKRVEDIQKEVNVNSINAEADLERATRLIRKELNERIKENAERLLKLEQEMKTGTRTKEPEIKTPASRSGSRSSEREMASQVTFSAAVEPLIATGIALGQIDEEPDLPTDDVLRNLDFRVLSLERKLADYSSKSGQRTPSITSKESPKAIQEADFSQELQTQHFAMLQEIEGLKDIYKDAIGVTQSKMTEDGNPGTEPINGRIDALEQGIVTVTEQVRTGIENLRDQWTDLHKTMARKSELETCEHDVEHLKALFASLSEEVSESRVKVSQLSDTESKLISERQMRRTAKIQIAVKSINDGIQQKQLLANVGSILAKDSAIARRISIQSANEQSEQFQGFETRHNFVMHEIEKLKSGASNTDKEITEIEQHFERQTHFFTESLQRIKTELSEKLENVHEMFGNSTEAPDAAKNLIGLKGVIMKLQREMRELNSKVEKLPSESQMIIEPPLNEGDDREAARTKYIYSLLQKHESQMKTMNIVIKQIGDDFEGMQQFLRKQMESQAAIRLGELEDFRFELSGMMKKVSDGVKLSQRDVERVNELYEKLELKGDKAEIALKVDKTDLKRAYGNLSKRIDQFKDDLKRTAEARLSPVHEDAAVTTKKIDLECLSCGQEVASADNQRDGRPMSRYPDRRLNRFGHGFSKLLPILNNLTLDLKHRRVRSDAASRDRVRPVRLRTNESERAFSTTRLQSQTTTPMR